MAKIASISGLHPVTTKEEYISPNMPDVTFVIFPRKEKFEEEEIVTYQAAEATCGKMIVEPTRISYINKQGISVMKTVKESCFFSKEDCQEQIEKIIARNDADWIRKIIKMGNDYIKSVKPKELKELN